MMLGPGDGGAVHAYVGKFPSRPNDIREVLPGTRAPLGACRLAPTLGCDTWVHGTCTVALPRSWWR